MRRAGPLLAIALLAACRGEPSQIQVLVDAEPLVRSQAATLSVTILGEARGASFERDQDRVYEREAPIALTEWPRSFAVAPLNQDATRRYLFEAVALRSDGSRLATARIISGYVEGQTRRVVLLLTDACIGVPCEDLDETCDPDLRECTDAERDPGDFEEVGRDAGLPDGGTGTGGCAEDADCDDGVACTLDRCVGGRCTREFQDGRCDDGIACTQDLCLEEIGCVARARDERCDDGVDCSVDRCVEGVGCEFEAMDARCTEGPDGRCDLEAGLCQYSACDPATCVPGPCRPMARCEGDVCVRPSVCSMSEACCADMCVTPGCDDGEFCTADACGPGGCENVAMVGMSCDDGDPCTLGDLCNADGDCDPGPRCDDGDPCTVGTCGASGCTYGDAPDGTPCGPADGCSVCVGGTCEVRSCDMDAGRMDGGVVIDAGRDAGRRFDACVGTVCAMGFCCDGECCDTACCDTSIGEYCDRSGFAPTCVTDGGVLFDGGVPSDACFCGSGFECCAGDCCDTSSGELCVGGVCVVFDDAGGPGSDSGMIMMTPEGGLP